MALVAVALTAAAALAPAAEAQPRPWKGYPIPFRCEIQDVGTGVDYPDRDAEPLCVEFDKTNQNVTGLGLVEFLSREPARTRAAADNCFYYQRDHWTGSVNQDRPPELWHWDGSYFFDRAAGIGGVSFRNFRALGARSGASSLGPYLYPGGGGGGILVSHVRADPRCAELVDTREERRAIYRPWYRRIA